jgi:hypothetical protein
VSLPQLLQRVAIDTNISSFQLLIFNFFCKSLFNFLSESIVATLSFVYRASELKKAGRWHLRYIIDNQGPLIAIKWKS